VGLAALAVRMREVPLHSMHVAAEALSRTVDERVVQSTGCLYPDLADILAVSAAVATAVAEDAYDRGIAQVTPKPADMGAHIRASMWSPKY
jgi:malate dehydrogenase (oxaloacetate-decarboxylating)(NADP+)